MQISGDDTVLLRNVKNENDMLKLKEDLQRVYNWVDKYDITNDGDEFKCIKIITIQPQAMWTQLMILIFSGIGG